MTVSSSTGATTASPARVAKEPDAALLRAAQAGQVDEVRRALARGADLDVVDPLGASALSVAAACGHIDVIRALLGAGARPAASPASLIAAARGGDLTIVELLLAHGAPLEPRDHLRRGPLYWAASGGHRDVVRLLLDRGADLHARDFHGDTPLHAAAGNLTDAEVIRDLIARGARIDAVDDGGSTPIDFAEREGETDLMASMREWAAAAP